MRLAFPSAALPALVAVAMLSIRATPPDVFAADAPGKPGAAGSALTADEKAFFSWWDGLGFPDVTKLPFVKLWTPYRHHSTAGKSDESWPEGAFLVAEDGKKFTIFHTDLSVDRLETKAPDPKDEQDRGTRFERADLAQYVRDGLERLEKVGPDVPWFEKPDPFDAHRWSIPNQAFRIAVLARACAGRGIDDLAHRLMDRAQHEETRPAMTQQWGDDDPRPRASLDSIKGSIQSESLNVLTRSLSDASLSWSDLLREHERWARAFQPDLLTSPDGIVARLRSIVEDEKSLRAQPRKPIESLTPEERVDRLIHDLRDVGAYDHNEWRRNDDKSPPNAADQLKAIGFAAVPALIDALDDDRPSRSVQIHFSHKGQFRDSAWAQRVGDLVWGILDDLAGGTLSKTQHGGPPTSGQPTKRQVAERWYASVKDRGEAAVLADEVKKGGDGSREAADRLVKLDAAAAVAAMEAGIVAAASDRNARINLVYALSAVKTEAATAALLRLLPLLHGSDGGIHVASSLFARGRNEGLKDMIVQWREEASGRRDPFASPFRHTHGSIVQALAATNAPEAIRALSDGLDARDLHDRLGVIQVFRPERRPPGFPPSDVKPPSEEVERLIEALLAARLEDVDRAKGMTMGSVAAGQQPIVGEIALWVLSERYPKRYAFNPDGGPRDREAQRIAAANAWRKATGKPALEPTAKKKRAAPTPTSIEEIRGDFDRAAKETDEEKRSETIDALEAKGLAAVPALRKALPGLPKSAPGKADLESLVRRLSMTVADVEITGDAALVSDALRAALDATKGERVRGEMWWQLYADFVTHAPEGATTRLELAMERDGAEFGVLVKAKLSATKPGIGTQDEGDVAFDHPSFRIDSNVRRGGVGALPARVMTRPDTFDEDKTQFDETVEMAGLDAVVSIEGEVTVHR